LEHFECSTLYYIEELSWIVHIVYQRASGVVDLLGIKVEFFYEGRVSWRQQRQGREEVNHSLVVVEVVLF
jgi:hypothetical protein